MADTNDNFLFLVEGFHVFPWEITLRQLADRERSSSFLRQLADSFGMTGLSSAI